MIKIYLKNKNFQLSDNLFHHEFRCKCDNQFCTSTLIDSDVINLFEYLRKKVGNLPIKINSAYRCNAHNYQLDKSSKISQHMLGRALDCQPPSGVKLEEFEKEARMAGFVYTYINQEKNFCHMDIRRE